MKFVMSMTLLLALLAPLAALAGCNAPGEKQCKEVCLRYRSFDHQERWADKLAAATSDAERKDIEAQKAADWDDIVNNPERGLGACVAACDRPMRQSMVDCMMKAENLAEAKECDRR